jgi:hypothetical protein
MNYIEKKESQLNELKTVVTKWENKLKFSLNSLFIFILLLTVYMYNPVLGFIPTIIISFFVLLFTQQTIRSYNYLKFHRVSLNALKILHKMIDIKKGGL